MLLCNLFSPEASHIQAVVISRSGRTFEAVRAAKALTQSLHIPTVEIDGSLDATNCMVSYNQGGKTVAVATIGRDVQSLEFEGWDRSFASEIAPCNHQ